MQRHHARQTCSLIAAPAEDCRMEGEAQMLTSRWRRLWLQWRACRLLSLAHADLNRAGTWMPASRLPISKSHRVLLLNTQQGAPDFSSLLNRNDDMVHVMHGQPILEAAPRSLQPYAGCWHHAQGHQAKYSCNPPWPLCLAAVRCCMIVARKMAAWQSQ